MHALMTVFYNYSGNDGDKHKLNKGELKQLLHSELNHFLTVNDHIAFNSCIYIVYKKKIRNFSIYFCVISNNLNKRVSGHLCSKHEAALWFLIDCVEPPMEEEEGVEEIAEVTADPGSCVVAMTESEALAPSDIFLSSALALPQRDGKPRVLAHHQHHRRRPMSRPDIESPMMSSASPRAAVAFQIRDLEPAQHSTSISWRRPGRGD